MSSTHLPIAGLDLLGGLGKLSDGIWIGILGLAFVLGLLFAANANQRSSDR